MKNYILYLSFLITGTVMGQSVIRGRIIDLNNKGISYATIQSINHQSVTNKAGYFEMKTATDTVVLTIRHVGYQTKIDTINMSKANGFISIILTKKEINLDSVTVKTKRYPEFLIDYEISEGVIYTLNRRNKKRFVKTFNPEKSWVLEKEVPKKFNEIKKDCFGNILLISEDSVNQIFVYNNEIVTIAKFSISDYQKQLEPCVAAFNNRVIVTKYANHDQQLIFDLYHNKAVTHLANIWDKEASKVAQAYYAEIIRLYYQNTPEEQNIIELGVWDGDLVKLSVRYTIKAINGMILYSGWTVEQIGWYENVAALPLYCPVFVQANNLLLFDFVNGTLNTYDFNGKQLKSLNISFHKDKDWLPQVLLNEETQKLYTLYHINNSFVIKEIDINTGLVNNAFEICKSCYPEQISVYKNELFYVTDLKLRRVSIYK
jgi:hypothetical protein